MTLFVLISLLFLAVASEFPPVVIVPGYSGSRLQGRFEAKHPLGRYCYTDTPGWFDLWVSAAGFLPFAYECWIDSMRLEWGPNGFENPDGVYTRIVDFGNTSGIEYLNTYFTSETLYFAKTVQALVDAGGERGVTVRAAPYDWRYSPDSTVGVQFLIDLQALIEDTYSLNNNTPVSLVAHSMGCLYSVLLLNSLPQEWKDKYIQVFIPVAPAWGGSSKILEIILTGDTQGMPVYHTPIRTMERTWGAHYLLMPNKHVFHDLTVVRRLDGDNTTDYSTNDLEQLFSDANFEGAYANYTRLEKFRNAPLTFPGVPTHMFYSHMVATPLRYEYSAGLDGYFATTDVDGDGTVPKIAAEWVIPHWDNEVFGYTLMDCLSRNGQECGHTNILHNTEFHQLLLDMLLFEPIELTHI